MEVVAFGSEDSEVIAGAGECDVEESAFFFDFFSAAGGHVGGDIAVGGVDDGDGVPFESFGGVDGAEDEEVFIEEWIGGEILGGGRGIKSHLGEEFAAGLIACGDGFELFEVVKPSGGVVVCGFDQGAVVDADGMNIGSDTAWEITGSCGEGIEELQESGPEIAECLRGVPVVPC